ncbi:MAG: glutamate--cysteine ligase [Gammaproteobacteria bacterium]|nr:glutamate--cysteine ligase [Gammaproteobacteria bacterium]
MGLEIDQINFMPEDFTRFGNRLQSNLRALKSLLKRPDFGEGPLSFGAELELYIVDAEARPLQVNQEIQARLDDPQLTLELNRYNLEYNFSPSLLTEGCLGRTQDEAINALNRINEVATDLGGSVVPIGILPTLQQSDTGYHTMTPLARFEVLTNELTELRGGPFTIAIDGEEALQLAMDDVTLEGANTSFQIHLRVPPDEFADFYNAVQLVTPLVVAMAANSPTLFGQRLWQETRIPLFKQSIDCRPKDSMHPMPARVNFGNNWLREGAFELFAEAALLYRPIFPVSGDEDPEAVVNTGGIPRLDELRLHQGSIWLWNRPVYDPVDSGHLRIEFRALPAGPSIVDMLANAAMAIGLAKVMQKEIRNLLPAIPFTYCTANFYRAAQKGLEAELFWPSPRQTQPEYFTVPAILEKLLPAVPEQLHTMGFLPQDFQPFLDVVDERLDTGQTGSRWQLEKLSQLRKSMHKREALVEMLLQYQKNSAANIPVARWQ